MESLQLATNDNFYHHHNYSSSSNDEYFNKGCSRTRYFLFKLRLRDWTLLYRPSTIKMNWYRTLSVF